MQQTTPLSLKESVTGVVLAGGMGRRMQGVDKGLVLLNGRAMISYVIEALRGNVAEVMVNANRNQQQYQQYNVQVIEDTLQGYQGPLAGVEAAMSVAKTPWIFFCPCDSPLHHTELLPRLWRQAIADGSEAEVVMASDGERNQPVFTLLKTSLLPSLRDYLAAGERKIDRWYQQHHTVVVDCHDLSDSFININTDAEKLRIESQLN